MKRQFSQPSGPERRRAVQPLVVLGLLGSGSAVALAALGLCGALTPSASGPDRSPATAGTWSPASSVPTPLQAPDPVPSAPSRASAAYPVAIQIPSIKVDAPLELLGLALDGTLQTPTDPRKPGWFTGSSLPGEPGPAVIAGHVDSDTGPAVFLHLKDVKIGDLITITLSGEGRVAYRVTALASYAKDRFPTQRVYGPQPDSELRLITCGGAFVQGQYVDDVVVFAKLAA